MRIKLQCHHVADRLWKCLLNSQQDNTGPRRPGKREASTGTCCMVSSGMGAPRPRGSTARACDTPSPLRYIVLVRPFSADTSPEAHATQVELLRQRTPAQRIAMVKRIRQGADSMARARLRRDYPDDDAQMEALRLASLKYDDELIIRAYGWDPAKEGR